MIKDKRGIAWKSILSAIIIFTFLLLAISLFLGKGGLWGETTGKTKETLEGMLPDVSLGSEELKGETPAIKEIGGETALNRLKEEIEKMLNSPQKNCLGNYGGLRLAERGTIINFKYDGEKTTMVVETKGGKQTKEMKDFLMTPCVIAGESGGKDVSENFYDTFLEPAERVGGEIYSLVNNIKISWDDGGTFGYAETRIDFGSGFKDFEDGGWLFKPENNYICFFPTVDGYNDADGLNDDYVSGNGERSLRSRIGQASSNNKKLDYC